MNTDGHGFGRRSRGGNCPANASRLREAGAAKDRFPSAPNIGSREEDNHR